ncbi:MAG: pyrimidine dimer DNA glycosylase/endonuclease V [Bacteroidota bacterium]|nr:pyrimidine dimer DNA glycosylase/endonuclease V [Bacteroidota bacterium]
MTRINIISPSELTDQHLIAEYREIFMVPGSLKRTLISKNGYLQSKVPKEYTLNSGHVYFFYNKGKYLNKRYNLIIKEMKLRGFNPDKERKFPKDIFINNNLYNDWSPNQNDIKIIRQRISEKIALKPTWYRKTISK